MALFGKRNPKDPEDGNSPENINDTAEQAEAKEETPASDTARTDGGTVPENFDFNRYFLAERRIVLDNVSYETQRPAPGQLKLNVKDTIVAQIMGPGVKVTYNRSLRFEPEGPFTLSVTFGVLLVFNPGTKNEVDWRTVDVAAEFRKNCPQLVEIMSSKAALLVAEITNANGGNPLIIRK